MKALVFMNFHLRADISSIQTCCFQPFKWFAFTLFSHNPGLKNTLSTGDRKSFYCAGFPRFPFFFSISVNLIFVAVYWNTSRLQLWLRELFAVKKNCIHFCKCLENALLTFPHDSSFASLPSNSSTFDPATSGQCQTFVYHSTSISTVNQVIHPIQLLFWRI